MKKYQIIFLLLILCLAVFFRIWQLDSAPPGLYPDEAMNGNDALQTLENKQFKLFYPENNGREGLYIWLISFSFYLFGPVAWSLRLVSAIFGILTILALYLLAKEMFDKKIALASSFFLAVSFWHVNFSRIGFRAVLVPFLLCFSFYFLWRAWRRNKFWDYVWSGIFFGLGFYTYIAFRMAVLILGLLLILDLIKSKKIKWQSVALLIVIFIVALPIGLHFLSQPQDFLGRAGGVSVFQAEEPLKALSISTGKTLAMFNLSGDGNWRHNLAGWPMLSWPIGLLFIIGLILTFKRIRKDTLISLFLIGWFLAMLLPAVLTCEGLPHALRTIGVIPVVYIFSALGLIWLFEKIYPLNKKIAWLMLVFLLLYPALDNFNKYFLRWAVDSETAGAFRQDLVDLSYQLKELPPQAEKYIIVQERGVPVPYPDGLAMPAQTIIFQAKALGLKGLKYFKSSQIDQIDPSSAFIYEIR